jgi:hypothetical protein
MRFRKRWCEIMESSGVVWSHVLVGNAQIWAAELCAPVTLLYCRRRSGNMCGFSFWGQSHHGQFSDSKIKFRLRLYPVGRTIPFHGRKAEVCGCYQSYFAIHSVVAVTDTFGPERLVIAHHLVTPFEGYYETAQAYQLKAIYYQLQNRYCYRPLTATILAVFIFGTHMLIQELRNRWVTRRFNDF